MPSALTREQVDQVRAALIAGMSRELAADRFGLPIGTVRSIAVGRTTGRATPPAELADGWEPSCMEPDEWVAWQESNRRLALGYQAPRPCSDCLLGYAAEMRATGRCNGQPGGDAHDEHEETAHMDDQAKAMIASIPEAPTRRVSIEVSAPCPGCSHQPVCRIADEVAAIERAQVAVPKLGQGLAMTLSARVDCEYFAPVKRSGPGRPAGSGKGWTPEQREAAAERARQMNARKAAKAAEADGRA